MIYLVLTVILIIAIFPVLYTILGSFKGNMELLTEGNRLFPRKFVLDNYIQAWNLADFEKYTGCKVLVDAVALSGIEEKRLTEIKAWVRWGDCGCVGVGMHSAI